MKTADTNQRLKNYLLTAGTLSTAAMAAQAQIIYTDVNPDYVLDTNLETYSLDINNDGTPEAIFLMYNGVISSSIAAYGVALYSSSNSVGVVGNYGYYNWNGSSTSFGVLSALDDNVTVDINANFMSYGFAGLEAFYVNNPGSVLTIPEWFGKDDKYMGIVFSDGVSVNFGWMRCSMNNDGTIFTIKDYAYNSQNNAPILTGATTPVGLEEVSAEQIHIQQRGSKVNVLLAGDLKGGSVKVFNATGQLVHEEVIAGSQVRLDLSDKEGGVYSISVQNGATVSSKKIILF